MMRKTCCVLMCCAGLPFLSFSDSLPQNEPAKIVAPVGLTPIYDRPVAGGLPISYLEPTDNCRIDSTRFDNDNNEWVYVHSSSRSGWLLKTTLRNISVSQNMQSSSTGNRSTIDQDAKRRYRIIEQHPEWERRFVKVVREGKICLDMNEDQLLASWGDPVQKTGGFILGAGKPDVLLFRGPSGKFEVVFLVKGKVAGWTN